MKTYNILKTRDGEAKGTMYMKDLALEQAREELMNKAWHICDGGAPNELYLNSRDVEADIEFCADDPKAVEALKGIIASGDYGVYTNVNEGCDLLYKIGSDVFRYDSYTYEIIEA